MGVLLVVLSFIWWWPLGLAVLGFFIARRRYGYWRHASYAGEAQMLDRGCGGDRWDRKMARMQEKMERLRSRMDRAGGSNFGFGPSSSGNRAFDDYRAETLKRLEDEQREFKDFLDQLRVAKDRAEFDQFMAARRPRPAGPDAPSGPTPIEPRP